MNYAEPIEVKGDVVTWRLKVNRGGYQPTDRVDNPKPPQGGSGEPVKPGAFWAYSVIEDGNLLAAGLILRQAGE